MLDVWIGFRRESVGYSRARQLRARAVCKSSISVLCRIIHCYRQLEKDCMRGRTCKEGWRKVVSAFVSCSWSRTLKGVHCSYSRLELSRRATSFSETKIGRGRRTCTSGKHRRCKHELVKKASSPSLFFHPSQATNKLVYSTLVVPEQERVEGSESRSAEDRREGRMRTAYLG